MLKDKFSLRKDIPVLLLIVILWVGAVIFVPGNAAPGSSPKATAAPVITETNKIVKVAAVGDSNTYGAGVDTDNREKNSYPAQLQTLLGDKYQVSNYGVGGTTLISSYEKAFVKTEQFDQSLADNPDIVLIMLGTNDAMGINWDKAKYEQDLLTLVTTYKQLESKPRVYLLTVPFAYSVGGEAFPIDITGETVTNEVVPLIKKIAKQTNTPVIDIYAKTKGYPELFSDKIHPNAVGYTIIAESVYEAIR